MKKAAVVLLFVFCFIGAVHAATDDDKINKAMKCLDRRIEESPRLTLEEAVFSVLSGVSAEKARSQIQEQMSGEGCWPVSGCDVKSSAQGLLARRSLGEDTQKSIAWLKSKTGISKDLTWNLQITIENNVPASCTVIPSGSSDVSVSIGNDMKVSGNFGECFSASLSGYWLVINPLCFDKEMSISCDQGFKTNLLYYQRDDSTVYVSPTTHGAAAKGITKEKVSATCFLKGTSCDYESSLWAATALYTSGEDVKAFIPYLIALAPENEKYLPDAFLIYLVGGDRQNAHYVSLMQQQKPGGYWQAQNTMYNFYYDTSLAMLSLGGNNAQEVSSTLTYLFDKQTDEGCWNSNSIRDSAFIIYAAGWQRASSGGGVIVPGETNVTGNGTVSPDQPYDPDVVSDCEASGYYCAPDAVTCLEAGGDILSEERFSCTRYTQACCTVPAEASLRSCFDLGGEVCGADEQCPVDGVPASDGSCCLEGCEPRESEDEPQQPNDIPGPVEEKGSLRWMIVLFSVLILLVLIGIIYRSKIRLWLYTRKGKATTTPVGRGAPPGIVRRFPPGPSGGIMPRGLPPAVVRRPMSAMRPVLPNRRTAISEKDKEMEETLKKLKEMSK